MVEARIKELGGTYEKAGELWGVSLGFPFNRSVDTHGVVVLDIRPPSSRMVS